MADEEGARAELGAQAMVGAVVSTMVIVWLQVELLLARSIALQVRVFRISIQGTGQTLRVGFQ